MKVGLLEFPRHLGHGESHIREAEQLQPIKKKEHGNNVLAID